MQLSPKTTYWLLLAVYVLSTAYAIAAALYPEVPRPRTTACSVCSGVLK